ncbi:MAG: DNA polymerase III subunit delta [Roseburia hominis]
MKTIDEDIRSGNLKQIYLLYGTEDYLKRQYRDKLKNALTAAGEDFGMGGMLSGGDGDMNFNRFEGKDINPKQVIDLAETLPFFAERRVILIENSGFFKNACDELAEYLAQPAASTYFVFVEEEVDKRSKMYKAVKNAGKIVEFATQTEELITRWVLARLKKEGKNITGSVMQLFLSKTGSDMGNIDRELEKLICYTMDKSVIEAADVEAIATEQTTNRIFEMVNAIAEHNQRRALDLYYDLLTLKEPPMRIMYLITRQFQILLHLRDMAGKGFDNQTMAQKAGIPPFAVKRNLTQARGFGAGQLRQALEEGVALEEAVKTGRMNDQMAVELFIIRYSAAKQKKLKKHQYDGTGVFHTVGLGPYVKIYSLELSQRVNKLC